MLPISKVNKPEAIITANITIHQVIPSLHSKGRIIKEDSLQSSGVLHTTKIHPSYIILPCHQGEQELQYSNQHSLPTWRLFLLLLYIHLIKIPGKLVQHPHQGWDSVHQVHPHALQVVHGLYGICVLSSTLPVV